MNRPPTWIGPFDSWSEAANAAAGDSAGDTGSVFGLHSWLSRQAGFLADVRRGEWRRPTIRMSRTSTLPLVLAGFAPGPLRVIDLGGGSGWVADACSLSGISCEDYLVIERGDVAEAFGRTQRSPVRYASLSSRWELLVDEHVQWDVLYANSSLQYSKSNQLLMAVAVRARPRLVLLDDVLTTPADQDGFAVQVNSDRHEPVRFASLGALEAEFADAGYQYVWSVSFCQPGYANHAETSDPTRLPTEPKPLSLLYRQMGEAR